MVRVVIDWRALVCAVALLGCKGEPASTSSAKVEKPDVERGAYLAKLLGCPFCHAAIDAKGPDHRRPYAGGMVVSEPAGTWRGPNITPHEGTGIGRWTDDQISAAIREGVRPDETRLYPVMPYAFYNRMTDDDARALVGFLRSLAPIDNRVDRSQLAMPRPPVPKPANAPDRRDDPVKHGEYLVTLMHCSACHATPDANGLPDMTKPFAGGRAMQPFGPGLAQVGTGNLYASNLTPDPKTGIGTWSADDIARSIATLVRPDGTLIRGPMQFYLAGWAVLDDRDRRAIAAYLMALAPVEHAVPRSTFVPTP